MFFANATATVYSPMQSMSESNVTKRSCKKHRSVSFFLWMSSAPMKDLIMASSVSFLQMSLRLSESVGNAVWCAFYFPQLLWLSGQTQAIKFLFLFLFLDFLIKSVMKDSTKRLIVMVLKETFLSYFTPILQTGDISYKLAQLGHP